MDFAKEENKTGQHSLDTISEFGKEDHEAVKVTDARKLKQEQDMMNTHNMADLLEQEFVTITLNNCQTLFKATFWYAIKESPYICF